MTMEKRQLWTLEDKQISYTNQPIVHCLYLVYFKYMYIC